VSSTANFTICGKDIAVRLAAGSHTYGDAAHLHAATAVGSGYTAKYDASGNMTCRAPTSSQTCSGTLTGAALNYDNEGRLTAWQNAQSGPTSTDNFLYDGEGNRVEQQSVVSGTTTTTVYVGSVEELKTTAGSTTTTTYYLLGGQRIALAVNGTLSYLASDLLGSTTVALDGAGNVTASQLFTPYGTSRYSNGTMPTDRGFTGQHADAVTGLDYYNARYYDPAVGQFTSADAILAGLNRYAYVGDNPESKADPTGHKLIGCEFGDCGHSPHDAGSGRGSRHHKRPPHDAGTGRGSLHPKPKPWFDLGWGSPSLQRTKNLTDFGFDGNSPTSCGLTSQGDCGKYGVLYAVYTPYGQVGVPGVWNCLLDICDAGGGDNSKSESELEDAYYFESACGRLSFSADTEVATPDGERAIGKLKVGDKVIAYDPKTGKTSEQTVEHVWLNHDGDLLDVTLRHDNASQVSAPPKRKEQRVAVEAHGSQAPPTTTASDQTIHTTERHPWLTVDKGWLEAGELRLGEQVVRLDGSTATVVGLRQRVGEQADYYNLTVSQLHTYAVGSGRVVVHNSCVGDRLPVYKTGDKTRGILVVDGKETDLTSGWPGPKLEPGTPGAKLTINRDRHVEVQAAALMREGGITKADLWINNDPCPGRYACGNMLQHMLPEGAQLDLYVKKPGGWDHTTIIGKPDADYTGP
jgi:RHS repeat-associated protein